MGAECLDHGRQPTSPTRKEKGRLSRRPQSCSFPDRKGRGRGELNGSRTALRGAVSGRSVFNETARPASPAWRAALACGSSFTRCPRPGTRPSAGRRPLRKEEQAALRESCAGSRIAFHSAEFVLGPAVRTGPAGCVTGFRESAVEGFAPIPPPLSRAHAAQAECDPGSQRKTLPRSGAELISLEASGRPETSLRQLRTRNAPFDIVAASFDMMRSDAQHDRRRRAS